MNRTTPDVQLVLREWFADDGDIAPDRILDVVADRIVSQPQHRASRLHWRPAVNRYSKVAGVAAVIAVLVVGYNLLPRQPSSGGQSPVPSPTVAPSPTPTADASSPAALPSCEPLFGCEPLPAGTYETAAFRPTLTFTVPPGGWTHEGDRARGFSLGKSSSRFGVLGVSVMSQRAIPVQDDCSGDRKPGAGDTVQDWVAFLIEHPGLETTKPVPVALGGFDGMQLDVKVAASWTLTCPESEGPAVVLIAGSDPIDTARVRFRILDVAGQTVIVYVDESDSSLGSLEERDAALKPLLDTLEFTP